MSKWVEFECPECGEITEVYGRLEDDGDGGTEFVPANMIDECMVNGYGEPVCSHGHDMERI